MELLLRCRIPDKPGALATLASAIAHAGGDIQAIDLIESAEGMATDDLWVVTDQPEVVVDAIEASEGAEVIHAGPSRGQPGDAVSRLALGLQAVLQGAMTVDHGVRVLVGGLLHASSVEVYPADAVRPVRDRRVLVLAFGDSTLVVRREYRFTHTERDRAEAIVRVCWEAALLSPPDDEVA